VWLLKAEPQRPFEAQGELKPGWKDQLMARLKLCPDADGQIYRDCDVFIGVGRGIYWAIF